MMPASRFSSSSSPLDSESSETSHFVGGHRVARLLDHPGQPGQLSDPLVAVPDVEDLVPPVLDGEDVLAHRCSRDSP